MWQLARAWPLADEDHEPGALFNGFIRTMLDEPELRGEPRLTNIFHSRLEPVARLFNSMMEYLVDIPWTPLEDISKEDELRVYHAHIFVRLVLLSFFCNRDAKVQSCLDLKLRISKPRPCLALKDYRERGTTLATMNDTGNRGTSSSSAPPMLAGHSMDNKQLQRSKSRRQVSPSPSGSASHLGPSNVSMSSVGSKRRRASITQPEDPGSDAAASGVDGRALKKQKLAVEDNVSSRTASTSQTAGQTVAQDDIGSDAAASVMGDRPDDDVSSRVSVLTEVQSSSSSAAKPSTSMLPQATTAVWWRKGPCRPRVLKGVAHHSALGRRHTSQYFRLWKGRGERKTKPEEDAEKQKPTMVLVEKAEVERRKDGEDDVDRDAEALMAEDDDDLSE